MAKGAPISATFGLYFVEKYTPTLSMSKVPEAAIRGTGVIEITVEEWTGKFFDVDSTP